MTPESLTVSLDLARQLKEAGWPQEWDGSPWRYGKFAEDRELAVASCGFFDPESDWHRITSDFENFAAPTAEEILRRLPRYITLSALDVKTIHSSASQWWIDIQIDQARQFVIAYLTMEDGKVVAEERDVSLANAAAQMWLYLKKNNLLPS